MKAVYILSALLAIVNFGAVHSTRCYMCRDMLLKSGNRHMFSQSYKLLKEFSWIKPCSSMSFVVYPQVKCLERSYLTNDVCISRSCKTKQCKAARCTVKIIERYPILPPMMIKGNTFMTDRYKGSIIKLKEHQCKRDLCNGPYPDKHRDGLKCYHQCGKIHLYGLNKAELATYNLPVIPCDESTYTYCGSGMECGYIVGSADYTDVSLSRDITVVGWYADCFYSDSDDISHVLKTVSAMMMEHPSLKITENDLTKCGEDLCNYIE